MNAPVQLVLDTVRCVLRFLGLRPWIAALAGIVMLAIPAACLLYFPSRLGAAQPIPFSHRFHVSTKQLSCVFCHLGALTTDRAGVPPLETCMLCHKRIITTHPKIQELKRHYDEREPIPWVRVNRLSEFVFFSHQAHVRAGFDCGRCHGDVAKMDRVVPVVKLNNMGFCVQCHRDEGFSHDCLICHR